jgi:hypothetical protein
LPWLNGVSGGAEPLPGALAAVALHKTEDTLNKKLRSAFVLLATMSIILLTSIRMPADTGMCGGANVTLPFTDVMGNIFFCDIAEAYFSGLTNGTTPTTYSPSAGVVREQMAAFLSRTQDGALRRGSRRAALKQWSTPFSVPLTGRTTVGNHPALAESDGVDIWVANFNSGDVKRVRASDGRVLETWTGAAFAAGVLIARGRVYITGDAAPGVLYDLNPATGPGGVSTLSNTLGNLPFSLTTDGACIWTANQGGSVSIVNPDDGSTITVTNQLFNPSGILFDGTNIFVTDRGDNTLKRLDPNGTVVQFIHVGAEPDIPVFDGSNIWVPNFTGNTVTVVRARDMQQLAVLTGNGLNHPFQAAFDGQRILVTNSNGNSVSLWKATDLTPLGSFDMAASPTGACSDGINFWLTLPSVNILARF